MKCEICGRRGAERVTRTYFISRAWRLITRLFCRAGGLVYLTSALNHHSFDAELISINPVLCPDPRLLVGKPIRVTGVSSWRRTDGRAEFQASTLTRL